MRSTPRIRGSRAVFETPWFSLIEKRVEQGGDESSHYAIAAADYVTIVAHTPEGEILLVQQYRAAIEQPSLELPAGHVDEGERPEQSAARELEEETGYRAVSLEPLGWLWPDVGRLSNRLWCFLAQAEPTGKSHEEGLELIRATPEAVTSMIAEGRFRHALHVAVLSLASIRKLRSASSRGDNVGS